jgi:phosphatidate cytidylyltransferase
MLDDKIKRVISAVVLVLLILVFIIMGGAIFKVGVLGIIAIALYEYINVYKKTSNKVITSVIILGYIINIFIIFFNKTEFLLPMVYLIVLLSMSIPVFTKSYNVISSAITIVGYIYIINFFTLLAFVREWENGNRLILLVFIIAWFSDTFAYYIGRYLGKRKLCPEVSPKKTIEGFIGGIIGSCSGILLWASFIVKLEQTWYQLILFGIIAGIISQIGDLVASLIKRYIGVKDYGNIIPGHGGILDRFDSILFTTPIVYYYIKLFLGW